VTLAANAAKGVPRRQVLPSLIWRGQAWSDPVWLVARVLFAANWVYNFYPGKYQASWYQHEFSRRVGYFAAGNPWPAVHEFLQNSVLTHPVFFAGMAAAGETAAAVLVLLPITTRLGGAVAASVAISYSLSMDWVNLGYSVHNGSFAVLGLLFLALGGWLPLTGGRGARAGFALPGVAGLAAVPLASRWQGLLPTLPWIAAALALLVHGVAPRAKGGAA
jgi:uncharacterized membrane protein YphA (DoxX/SURF4 family)